MSIRQYGLPLLICFFASSAHEQATKKHYIDGDIGYHDFAQSYAITVCNTDENSTSQK